MTEHRKNMDKREIIYNGESVKIFGTEDPDKVLVCFTDNITAFNKIKRAVIADKGRMNCAIATMIYNILRDNGIDSHFIRNKNLNFALVEHFFAILNKEFFHRLVTNGIVSKENILANDSHQCHHQVVLEIKKVSHD